MPGGNYQVIVVPECKLMPLATFKQLLALANAGATVIFENHLPTDVPGWNDLEKQRNEFKKSVEQLSFQFQETVAGKLEEAKLGQGRAFRGDLWVMLLFANTVPEPMAQSGLSFVRRSFDGGWNYFIVNRSETNFDGWVPLSRPTKSVVILDPMTGNSGVAATRLSRRSEAKAEQSAANLTQVHLQLAAGESVILRAFASEAVKGPAWTYWQPQTSDAKAQTLTGTWNVKFIQGGPTLPADFQTAKLASWTMFPGTNTQAFAGTAKYTLEFNLQVASDTLKRELQPFALDLGDVRQSARVKVNGKDYGTLIAPPFRVLVDNLKPKGNVLEVEATSVAANRIRDLDRRGVPWKKFHDINFVNLNYEPFDAAHWPLSDCGLLGPVTLTAVAPEQPASAGN